MKIIKYITSSVANQNSVIFSDLCLKTASSLINKTILTKVFVVHQKLFVLSSKSRGGSTSHYPIIILLDEKKFWIGPWLMSNEWFTSRPIPPKTIENQQATNRSFTGKYPLFDTVWHHPPPFFSKILVTPPLFQAYMERDGGSRRKTRWIDSPLRSKSLSCVAPH